MKEGCLMYSSKLQEKLKSKGIDIGDRIKVAGPGGEFIGFLMPRPHYGDSDILVIKLSSGYNVGLKANSFELIEKSKVSAKSAPAEESIKNGHLSILGCGGTIASRIEYKTGAVYPSISASELKQSFPALKRWAVNSRQIFSLFSEDMNASHWRLLADAIEGEIKGGSNGIVVMHGTDTMTYTSSAISFMIQDPPVPIVFVGAQRSSDRPSSENEMNILNSAYAASKDFAEVSVCMHATTNDDYCHVHRGTRVRKMHTSRRDAFHSIDSDPLFSVDYRSETFSPLSEYRKRAPVSEMKISKKMNDNVALIYSHPNIKPSLISKLDDYDGVVFIGTGLGHLPANAFDDKSVRSVLEPVKALIDSGIPVVMSSQCINGRLCMRVYTSGRLLMDIGVIGDGMDWTPEVAYTKLCWVLGQTKDMKKIKEMMVTDYVGEICPRSGTQII